MKKWFKKHPNIAVFLMYIFLTLILTIPVIFEITRSIPGGHDAFEIFSYPFQIEKTNVNLINYFQKNPLELFNFRTAFLFLHKLVNEPLAYNIIWLLSFVFSAFGAYLLCNYLTKNRLISFLGGFIFAFSPLHFGYAMAFGGGTHIEFIPFFVLLFIRYLKEIKIRYLFLSLIFFIFVVSNEPHFVAYTILFIFIAEIYYLFKNKLYKNKKFVFSTLVCLILGLVFAITFYWPLIKISISDQNFLSPGLQAAIHFSNDVATFFTPGYLHPLWGNFFLNNLSKETFSGNSAEWSAYIGFLSFFFLIYAMIWRRKDKQILFWIFIFFFFLIMSLGPFLRFFGLVEPKIPLPYLLIYKYVPFFENIRSVGRAFIYASLALAILVSFGIKLFFENRKKPSKILLTIPILLIIFVEYWSVPYTSSIEIPTIYQIMAQDKENYAILQPGIANSHGLASMFTYWNAIHGKQIIGGFHFAREDPNLFKFEKQTPVINKILYDLSYGFPIKNTGNFISQNYKAISNLVFNKNNIKYIILHKKLAYWDIGTKKFIELNNFIKKNIEVEKVMENKDVIVYKIKQLDKYSHSIILQEEEGWEEANQTPKGEFVSYPKVNGATLKIINYADQIEKAKITLFVRSLNNFKILKVNFNNNLKGEYLVGENRRVIILNLDNINPGDNNLKFSISSLDGSEEAKLDEKDSIYFSVGYEEIDKIEYPNFYNKIINEKEDYKIIQLPIYDNYSFNIDKLDNKRIADKTIVDNEFFLDQIKNKKIRHSPIFDIILFNKISDYNDLETINTLDIQKSRQEIYSLFNNLKIKYIIIHKEYLNSKELSDINSIIAAIVPFKKVIVNNKDLQVYQILNCPINLNNYACNNSIQENYYIDFENNDLSKWDIIKGDENQISIINVSHSGKYSAEINTEFGQSFNGLVKNFVIPAKLAIVEGWLKINNWARGFAGLNFDFIYNPHNYLNSKMWDKNNLFLRDYFIGEIYKNNILATFGHNLLEDRWNKLKIIRDSNGFLEFYENDKKILDLKYNKKPIYGFKIGINGCCKESKINLIIDDFTIKYN